MAKLGYSVHYNFMDVPFTFAGWAKSKKDTDKLIATVEAEQGRFRRFTVIKEEKPGYAVGDRTSDWDQQPLPYPEFLIREAEAERWRAKFAAEAQ